MRIVNERSGLEYQAAFEAAGNVPTVPTTVHWRLRCVTNDETLQDWTLIGSTPTVDDGGALALVASTVNVPGAMNALIDRNNRREVRELQVVADKDTEREFSTVMQYYVVRMDGR